MVTLKVGTRLYAPFVAQPSEFIFFLAILLTIVLLTVIVRFRAAGNAPIMKQSKFKITASESFQTVADFLRRQLKFSQHDSLVWRTCYDHWDVIQ